MAASEMSLLQDTIESVIVMYCARWKSGQFWNFILEVQAWVVVVSFKVK